jgi:hypothetical protein
LNIIKDIVEYIKLEGVSCPSSTGIYDIIKNVVEYIVVERASCPSNRGI